MRLILASAAIAFLASSGSAMAADCTKGLLWPYVRNPGDCLTDTEVQAGKAGVYTGPATGQVDVSTIKPPPQLGSNAVQCSHSWYWPFGSDDCAAMPATTASSSAGAGATAGASATKDNSSAVVPPTQPGSAPPAVKPQAADTPNAPQPVAKPQAVVATPAATIQVAQSNTAECHKGIFWPFIRDNGDCATSAETGRGTTSAVPAAVSPSTQIPAAQPGTFATTQSCTRSWLWPIVSDSCVTEPSSAKMTAAVSMPAVAVAGPSAAGCTKGTFWPFIRESGDCPTAAEKSSGVTSTAPVAATEPAAMPASVAPPPSPPPAMPAVAIASPPAAATCSKGTFWPFIRESGDCPTAAEKGSGVTASAPVAATEPAAMMASVAPPPSPPPAMPAVAIASPPAAATCSKGTFWPFIRESGDCSTAAEKAGGQTSTVPIAASATPSGAVMQPAAAVAARSVVAACGRSWLWPFVREASDCQTTAEKGGTPASAVPISATAPAQTSGPEAANSAICHKGLFWPFVREAGDCPTGADKAAPH